MDPLAIRTRDNRLGQCVGNTLEFLAQSHQLWSIERLNYEQFIIHFTNLIPPNTQEEFFPWIFGLAVDVEAL